MTMPILTGAKLPNIETDCSERQKDTFPTVHGGHLITSPPHSTQELACYKTFVKIANGCRPAMTAFGKALEGQRFISPWRQARRFS